MKGKIENYRQTKDTTRYYRLTKEAVRKDRKLVTEIIENYKQRKYSNR